MKSRSAERSDHGPSCYRIVVRGEITARFAEVLEGVVVEVAGVESVLRVEDADKAKLQGVLSWLYEHGTELVSLRRIDDANPDGVARSLR